MYLLESFTKVIICHEENTRAMAFLYSFKLSSFTAAYNFIPKSSVLLAGQSIPYIFAPRITQFHQLMVNSFSVLQ